MADSNENKQDGKNAQENKQPDVVLIAHLHAVLLSGETLQLLPIRHENDVKSDVVKLLEDWAKSGFLLRGNVAYPWHQVRHVEVTKVEELPPHVVHQRMLELEGAGRAQMQQGFWKTRANAGKDQKDGDGKKDGEASGGESKSGEEKGGEDKKS